MDKDKFRLGHTKVFFRAGILGYMEEFREDKIGSVLSWLQSGARGKTSRMEFNVWATERRALLSCQRAIATMLMSKTWPWMQIWLAIKPTLRCTHFTKYKKQYETQIETAENNIGTAIAECKAVTVVYDRLVTEKTELTNVLESGDSAVQDIIDKTARMENVRNDLQKQVNETEQRVQSEENLIEGINNAGEKVTSDSNKLMDEIKSLENECEMAEEDKSTKDNQIKTLNNEIVHQEEMMVKLQKDKSGAKESRQSTEEDIQSAEDRCNHLGKVKGKLEQSLDECEDSLERERKAKGDVEKLKRKVEGDLKLTQETISDLEHVKADLSQTSMRKEKECSSMAAKIEDEKTLGLKYARQVKELQARIDELDEEIIVERQNRAKAEKNRSILSHDIEELGGYIEESGSNTCTHIELNKRREAELLRLKSELEDLHISHEGSLASLRSKQNSTMSDMGGQIDTLNKKKAKSEMDKSGVERDLLDARQGLDESMRDHANMEKNCKMTQGLIAENDAKLDELARALNEADSTKKRLSVESQDLNRQIEETENSIGQQSKSKISLSTQLEDTKLLADAEARDRAALLAKFKSLTSECESLKLLIEEESDKKNDNIRALSKAQSEVQLWKSKYEVEALGKIDELEGARSKIGSCAMEAEETIDALSTKVAATEKVNHRIESELEELSMEYERTHASAVITEKRGTNFDKVVCEWKVKAEDLKLELEASMSESRNYSSEVFRMKAALDDSNDQLDIVRRENKNLADEIKDLLDQLGDGGRSVHELDKQRHRLEIEQEELQTALEEAEGTLEQEENKVKYQRLFLLFYPMS